MARAGTLMMRRMDKAVIGVRDDAQVRDEVFDLAPLVEPDAADDLVRDAIVEELLFQSARLGVGAVQHGVVGVVPVARDGAVADDVDDGDGLLNLVGRFNQRDVFAVDVVGPQALVGPAPVVADDVVGGVEDGLGAAIVLFEFDNGRVGEVALEVEDDLHVGAPKGIDGVVDDDAPGDIVPQVL